MIIAPKIKGFICTTAHPAGCEKNILNYLAYLDAQPKINMPEIKNALVIGASTGYGLASAMTASFSLGASVTAVALEKNAKANRTATSGFYNLAAYKKQADARGLKLTPVIADAFSNQAKSKVGEIIVGADDPVRQHNKIDLLVYAIAAPARIDPDTGERYSSVLKPIGNAYSSKGLDLNSYKMNEIAIAPASEPEINNTVKVMGGEDLKLWVDYLTKHNKLSENAIVLAYSYIGPSITHGIYLNGTIGAAKNHLKQTADEISSRAYVAVNKAVVTQSSAAIPVVSLYISILFKIMKEKGLHEDCTEQIHRLFKKLADGENLTDKNGFIRIDDWEMRDDVQNEVAERWTRVSDDNLSELADLDGYRSDFIKLFGFGLDGVDYNADIETIVDEATLGFINLTE